MLFDFAVERATTNAKFLGHKGEIAIMFGNTGSNSRTFHGIKGSLTPNPSLRGRGVVTYCLRFPK